MTILQTTYHFGPDISIEFDKESEKYHRRLISKSGSYELEHVDHSRLLVEIDWILQREYDSFVRNIDKPKEPQKAKSLGHSGGNAKSPLRNKCIGKILLVS